LDKLKETQIEVTKMQADLAGKKMELEKKEKEASEKLKLMVNEKTIAE
jgi:dynein heavy chain 1